jgi:integrase
VASVEKRPDGKWRARYRPVPGGRQIARHFRHKIDAEPDRAAEQSQSRGLDGPRIDVAEAMPERSLELDTPKNHKRRTVPIPGFVVDELQKYIQGKRPDDLVFTNSAGRMLDNTNFRRNIWNPAARSIGLDGFTPHDLRHTTASLAVSAGANVKALQRLLGHASASMTLDVYSALFDSDLDAVAERLGKAAEDWLRTRSAKVASLDPRRVL